VLRRQERGANYLDGRPVQGVRGARGRLMMGQQWYLTRKVAQMMMEALGV
jgi:hypothetical protein